MFIEIIVHIVLLVFAVFLGFSFLKDFAKLNLMQKMAIIIIIVWAIAPLLLDIVMSI